MHAFFCMHFCSNCSHHNSLTAFFSRRHFCSHKSSHFLRKNLHFCAIIGPFLRMKLMQSKARFQGAKRKRMQDFISWTVQQKCPWRGWLTDLARDAAFPSRCPAWVVKKGTVRPQTSGGPWPFLIGQATSGSRGDFAGSSILKVCERTCNLPTQLRRKRSSSCRYQELAAFLVWPSLWSNLCAQIVINFSFPLAQSFISAAPKRVHARSKRWVGPASPR